MRSIGQTLSTESAASPAPAARITSEVGPLRRVIVNRPGPELERLTPSNTSEFLFDETVWVERAREEHDHLVAALHGASAEVLYLDQLLTETLQSDIARRRVLDATLAEVSLPPGPCSELAGWLSGLEPAQLAARLIGGITLGELPFHVESLVAAIRGHDAFVLAPLPNHVFTRDASAWFRDGVSIHVMALEPRRREAVHFDAIYRHHPLFADLRPVIWSDRVEGHMQIEGGDLFVLSDTTLMVGLSGRTSPAAVESYADYLFREGLAERLIAVAMPRTRRAIHLDSVLTMVDVDAFTVFRGLSDEFQTYVLTAAGGGVAVDPADNLFAEIRAALGVPRLRLINCDAEGEIAEREQLNEGNNVVAVAPGVVIAYERNTENNRRLREHGIEVIEIAGSELARGRGGPRCLTCPVYRAPL